MPRQALLPRQALPRQAVPRQHCQQAGQAPAPNQNQAEPAAGPHQCDECGKSFQIRDSLYKHRNVHRGSTTCPVCYVVLNRRGYLRHHLLQVHGKALARR